ncbi:formyl-CoA transferase [Microbacterium sp. BE35]|uniref:CaiB/BaiF CoA transferase family protein n=1 Tax=Microbacterium sp. BE35 TaxID=2817773 RepID=UPI002854F679|nr:CaiB/BaiF CoA-transferase family protein [Microbacterium sp. BE35]MDR7188224.1 formyl-CoA transferase [Microbacterium sp. BE35]
MSLKAEETPPAIDTTAPGPLNGVRVLELGSIVAASFAARMLADLGAEVIKIEGPDNLDPLREWGQGSVDGRSLWWSIQSRNKKLVTLDLHGDEGQRVFRDLAATSDVIVENFRPGTLERWNLGYDTLSAINPRLILARISGFGQTGPYRRRPGFAAVAEAMSGMRYINGYPDQAPPRVGLSLGDSIAGVFASQGILAALHERQRSGLGQEIDVSLVEACLAMMEGAVAEYDRLGIVRQPTGTRIPGVAPSNVFKTSDGLWFVIAASQQRMFERLCDTMGRPELITDERFRTHEARVRHQVVLEDLVGEWAGEHTAAQLQEMLEDSQIAAGPVYTIAELVNDPQIIAREALITHEVDTGDFIAQGITPRLSRTPGSVRWSGPWNPGSHNDEVFGDLLGYDEAQRDQLSDRRVI